MRELFFKNIGWKILSLALAVAIWLAVKAVSAEHSSQTERAFINIPAQIVSGTADVRAFKVEPDEVRVTVKAQPGTISALTSREIKVFVDVTGLENSQTLVKQLDVALPPGVALVNVDPSSVQVTMPSRAPLKSPANNP